jgi:hypothetical protein
MYFAQLYMLCMYLEASGTRLLLTLTLHAWHSGVEREASGGEAAVRCSPQTLKKTCTPRLFRLCSVTTLRYAITCSQRRSSLSGCAGNRTHRS